METSLHIAAMPAFAALSGQPSPAQPASFEAVEHDQLKAARSLLYELGGSSVGLARLLAGLPQALREGSPQGYTRHVAYADPYGRFTMAYLIWRPGQFSPVHGHRAWCAYRVLQGELSETHYRWDAALQTALKTGHATRRPDDVVTASSGLRQIHRLGNNGEQTAISLHIYGVRQADIATGVNLLVAGND